MEPRQKIIFFWAGMLLLAAVFIACFNSILFPFVLGTAVAYLLNPAVQKLETLGIARKFGALIILGLFFLTAIVVCLAVMPLLIGQIQDLINNIPRYVHQAQDILENVFKKLGPIAGSDEAAIKEMVNAQTDKGAMAETVLTGIIAGGQALLNAVSVSIIAPIVAWFMMKDWNVMTGAVTDLLPREKKQVILDIWREIDKKLAAFIRGQLTVMVVLGLGYAVALSLAGLQYGFLIGLMSGVLSIIPIAGTSVGFIVSIVVAFAQSGDWSYVAVIAAIFITGQLLEGNVLTPVLVGERVGLHPLWVFFALMAGGSLLGVFGMVIAVPSACAASVVLCFAIGRYKESRYYRG